MEQLIVIASIFIAVILARAVTVALHELGHAIPALIFTRQKVAIYLGSYGQQQKSIRVTLGLLDIWLSYDSLVWNGGLCVPSPQNKMSWRQQVLFVMGGPLATLLVLFISLYAAWVLDVFELNLLFSMLAVSSILDTWSNIAGASNPVATRDGQRFNNDFAYLGMLWAVRKFPEQYSHAVDFYNSKSYLEAAHEFDLMLADGLKTDMIYRLAISSYIFAKSYERAKTLVDEFDALECVKKDNDFISSGIVYTNLGKHDEAMLRYDKALQLNPNNCFGLNNKGYTLLAKEQYAEALPWLNRAIKIDNKQAYPFTNRGLVFIKTGEPEKALLDIQYSLSVDTNNAFTYLVYGIYFFDRNDFAEALNYFVKAKELDNDLMWVDRLIEEAKENITI